MKQFCALIGKFFGIIAIVFLVLGLTMPQNFLWVLGKVHGISVLSCMLGIVMFGMGTTLNLKDFALVLKRPLDILIGCCAQYFVMPFLAYLLSVAFNLDPALTTGVVLVGTCPGGTSSNVITFMSKGDVALSVTMTSVSTVLSPILTPFITYMIIGEKINFDPVGMFWSIVQIVILPICLGLAVKSFLPKLAEAATDYLPAVSSIAISLIIAGVIGASRDLILKAPGLICITAAVTLLALPSPASPASVGKRLLLCPSKLVCKTPVWQPAWQKHILLLCLPQPFPALFSPHGTIFPVHSLRGLTKTT